MSTLGSFDDALKSVYDELLTMPPEERERRQAKHDAWVAEWDALRAQLSPCVCGAPNSKLQFQCAQLGSMSYVWCNECALGTPARPGTGPGPVWLDGGDARPLAIAKWNEFVSRP